MSTTKKNNKFGKPSRGWKKKNKNISFCAKKEEKNHKNSLEISHDDNN
jgi:hypothetical protein